VDNKEVQVEGCGLGIGDHERGIVRPKKWRGLPYPFGGQPAKQLVKNRLAPVLYSVCIIDVL
jgi:hypothetical protein